MVFRSSQSTFLPRSLERYFVAGDFLLVDEQIRTDSPSDTVSLECFLSSLSCDRFRLTLSLLQRNEIPSNMIQTQKILSIFGFLKLVARLGPVPRVGTTMTVTGGHTAGVCLYFSDALTGTAQDSFYPAIASDTESKKMLPMAGVDTCQPTRTQVLDHARKKSA
jgi:hypothetical protein